MNWITFFIDKAVPVVMAVLTLIIGSSLIKVFNRLLTKQVKKSKMDESLKPFLLSVFSVVMKILLIIVVIGILGIPTASFCCCSRCRKSGDWSGFSRRSF